MTSSVFLLAAAGNNNNTSNPLVTFLPLLAIVVLAYFFFIRPQRNRQRAAMQTRAALVPGVEVMTTAGLFGRVAQVDDDEILLEVAPGVTMRFLKQAVARVTKPLDAPADGFGSPGIGPERAGERGEDDSGQARPAS